ncbi:probable Histone-lysine N-methyltransferase ATXR5 isoform X2 [Malania oleifera]|uniref:probable Histone-lysine N-methyltransferase ATXR5 isoform X2 n=1 Tax=Malania oleifera TaxID=397392 RepID=UPI0025AEC43E|nr:probable Histone-lysine N-methyltransferase ATXR5 isoform X2 [Malania oleifera]
MAPSSSAASTHKPSPCHGIVFRAAPPQLAAQPAKKFMSMAEVMANAKFAVVERDDYGEVICEQCGSGDRAEELLLCDKCDKGFHMFCLRPVMVRVPIGSWFCPKCSGQRRVFLRLRLQIFSAFRNVPMLLRNVHLHKVLWGFYVRNSESRLQDMRKRRKRSGSLVLYKKRRRLLPFTPTEDPARRLKQMGSLATALTALKMEFSDGLTYMLVMAPKSANQAKFENGGMQVLSREDAETVEYCKAMCKRGDCPPLAVVFDSCEGYTVEADGHIKDMTFITEYTGDVDYIKNREHDDCDSMMTLLLATDPSKSLVICPDKRGNIARFINGINNHTPEGRKKQNLKCVRYNVDGECRVFLVATRDIAEGERLYYDYNGYEHEYPTHHFV